MNTKNYIPLLQKAVTYCHCSTDPSRGKTEGKSDANNVLRVKVFRRVSPSPPGLCGAVVPGSAARARSLCLSPQHGPACGRPWVSLKFASLFIPAIPITGPAPAGSHRTCWNHSPASAGLCCGAGVVPSERRRHVGSGAVPSGCRERADGRRAASARHPRGRYSPAHHRLAVKRSPAVVKVSRVLSNAVALPW